MEEAKNHYRFTEQRKKDDATTNVVKKQKHKESVNNKSEMNIPRNLHYPCSVNDNTSDGVVNYAYENKEPENHSPSPNLYTQTTSFSNEYGNGKNSPSMNSAVINVRNEIDSPTRNEDFVHVSSSVESSTNQTLEINISRQGDTTAIDHNELVRRSKNFLKEDDVNTENQHPSRLPPLQLPTLVTS